MELKTLPSVSEKLKATFALGLSSNFSTLLGMLVAWIFLARSEWVTCFWDRVLFVIFLGPTFLADSVNSYVLNRIRLDHEKGWEDIQITDAGKASLARLGKVWRFLSFSASLAFAGILVASLSPDPQKYEGLKLLFPALFVLHFLRAGHTVLAYHAPKASVLGGRAFWKRVLLTGGFFLIWYSWIYNRGTQPFSVAGFFLHGMIFFILSGSIQPLPSKYSIFRPGRMPSSKPLLKVESICESDAQALSSTLSDEGKIWQEMGFEKVGALQTPLLELPLFRAAGFIYLSENRKDILLLLQSEVRQRLHRTLVSFCGSRVFITTDFGAPTAKFPSDVMYENRPYEETPGMFLRSHRSRSGEECRILKGNLKQLLQEFVDKMIGFLQTELGPPGETSAQVRPGEVTDGGNNEAEISDAEVIVVPAEDTGKRCDDDDRPRE